uniref:Uncharacterized protein n=1 Tax=Salix viminalis TaxID=40686 RepID=A0A6N2KC39_SALVM
MGWWSSFCSCTSLTSLGLCFVSMKPELQLNPSTETVVEDQVSLCKLYTNDGKPESSIAYLPNPLSFSTGWKQKMEAK